MFVIKALVDQSRDRKQILKLINIMIEHSMYCDLGGIYVLKQILDGTDVDLQYNFNLLYFKHVPNK